MRPGAAGSERAGEPGLAALLDSVAEDAARQADTARAEGRRAAEQRLADAANAARRIESEAEARGATEGAREARRRIALAEIETRKALLALRESVLQRAIEQASAHLCGRLESDGALVTAWIRAAARALGEPAPRVRLDAATRARVEPLLGDLAPVWEERAGAGPGVVVASADGRREVDATGPGVLARRGAQARAAAAAALFEGDAEPGP